MTTVYERKEANFLKFHDENPGVYMMCVRFAREAVRAGATRLSISLIIERVRWETMIVTQSEDKFKISNDHKPFYARLLARLPEFADLFKLKEQTSRRKEHTAKIKEESCSAG